MKNFQLINSNRVNRRIELEMNHENSFSTSLHINIYFPINFSLLFKFIRNALLSVALSVSTVHQTMVSVDEIFIKFIGFTISFSCRISVCSKLNYLA